MELKADVQNATPLSSSSGSPDCIPMLLIINASLPVSMICVAVTSLQQLPEPFFVGCPGSPFNTLIFFDAPSSACKRSSITLSDSSKTEGRRNSLKVRHHLYECLLVSAPDSAMLRALENIDGRVSRDQGHKVAQL